MPAIKQPKANAGNPGKSGKPAKSVKSAKTTVNNSAPAVAATPQEIAVVEPEVIAAPAVAAAGDDKVNTLEFTVYQGDTAVRLRTPIKNDTAQQVIGNVVSSLFSWADMMRAFKSKAFKFSQPLGLRFQVAGNLWDSGHMDVTFTERLKLQDTPQSRVAFAQKLYLLYVTTTTAAVPISYDEKLAMLRAAVPPPVKKVGTGAAKAA